MALMKQITKGSRSNTCRVKVSVSHPLWCAQAAGLSLCRALAHCACHAREEGHWPVSGLLQVSSELVCRIHGDCTRSGQPLTYPAINYCLPLSSVLNKWRDGDKMSETTRKKKVCIFTLLCKDFFCVTTDFLLL